MIINLKFFSELEKKWIILQFGKTPSPSTVRREFILHFKISVGGGEILPGGPVHKIS
ncbi:Hypothetical protein FKW44_011095 [Caligus rogercresseyi]|uniref:Uncharacterized protein n=1 Tax=Caligus rogercresseyi TaxID=217165 RepID=A0A7T8HHX1_CALRO|nr:Hypothetical protein FKW44_011095 [Caligus rogercresseyi]